LKKYICFLFILFLIGFGTQTNAQIKSLEWKPAGANLLRSRLNLETLQEEMEISSSNWKAVSNFEIDSEELQALKTKYYFGDPFILTNHTIRFVIQGTGMVFDYDTIRKSLKRIDKTIHSGYNFSASRFYRNNILFSVGGGGFWNYNPRITYFDDKTSKEWELYRPKNEGPAIIEEGYQGYSKKADAFFSGGGLKKNFLENEEFEYQKDFYSFDFKSKSWNNLGEINAKLKVKQSTTIFWNGTHFVQFGRDKVYLINPIENKVFVYQDNATYFEEGNHYFIKNDTIFYTKPQNLNSPLFIIPVNELLKKSTYVGEFYSKDFTFEIILIILLISISLSVILFIKWKKKKHKTLDETEKKVLNYFLKSSNKSITTIDLNEILDCTHKSQESQRRARHITINQINDFLEQEFQIQQAIERIPSEDDKRIIHYQLKKGIEQKIEKILEI